MTACTIIARNYLAQARVLAQSFKNHHPQGSFVVLIVDGSAEAPDGGHEAFDVLGLGEIGLEPGEVRRMAMIYNVTEFSTAVKPWLLRHLLQSSAAVVYFDPDIEIFAPLDHMGELARRYSIVLTPHTTVPPPRDKFRLTETDILKAGIYNLGFIAVGRDCEPFLDWWSERLRRECINDPERMRFTDQRWIDFVPGLFPHHILRDPTCNVAYWNLFARQLVWTGERYEVNGAPLRFFHYSGYDPEMPWILCKYLGSTPRILMSECPGVARLCGEYSHKLARAGFNETIRSQYGYAQSPGGLRIDDPMRRAYREALGAHENELEPEPPNPFEPNGTERFMEWLNEPVVRGARPVISRYLIALRESRADLQRMFPEAIGADAQAFYDWAVSHGSREGTLDPRLLPRAMEEGSGGVDDATSQSAPAGGAPVVTVAGYFHAELGIGEATSLLLTALEASPARYTTVSWRDTTSRQKHPFHKPVASGLHSDINILCVNVAQVPHFAWEAGPEFFRDRHTVAVWFWEIEEFPVAVHAGFDFVNEIWVSSDRIREALQKVCPKPVFCCPLPMPVREDIPAFSKAGLELPESFVFFFSFDFMSVFERKNPVAVIKAFQEAFRPGEGPILLIKSINGDKDLSNLERIRFAAAGRPDIKVVDGYVSAARKDALMAHCNCYVSLHRAEGFGLTLAEAMARGKPVIGTNYSGTLTFMTGENSFLCPFERRQIGPGAAPYPPDAYWAEPDLLEAARLMRHVYESPEEASARGRRAQEDLRARHSPEASARFIRERLTEIRRSRAAIEIASRATLQIASLEEGVTEIRAEATPEIASPDQPVAEIADPKPTSTERGQWAKPSPFGRSSGFFTRQRHSVRKRLTEARDLYFRVMVALHPNPRFRKFYREAQVIRSSQLFDGDWYRAEYGDLITRRTDPVLHYLRSGAARGSNPNPGFSTLWDICAKIRRWLPRRSIRWFTSSRAAAKGTIPVQLCISMEKQGKCDGEISSLLSRIAILRGEPVSGGSISVQRKF